jgi:SAC3 family protein LENG8/THP3
MVRDSSFWGTRLYIPFILRIRLVRTHLLRQGANGVEMNELLATLTPGEKKNENVDHALQVRAALATRNYHRLFRLYNSAPNMGGYLMDFFVERERVAACCVICKA